MAFDLDDDELRATRKLNGADKIFQKMSEDEIIKTIKEKTDIIKSLCTDDCINKSVVVQPLENAIQGLLDLYKNEKEKNKELTDFIEAIDELKQAKKPITDLVYEMNKFEDEFISKDKIKAKIEELINNPAPNIEERDSQIYTCDILEKLLEEE